MDCATSFKMVSTSAFVIVSFMFYFGRLCVAFTNLRNVADAYEVPNDLEDKGRA